MSTDGNDRTPTSSESEWPSAERKERCGRTVRSNDVRRLVNRWRQRKRIGETASEIASSVMAVTTLIFVGLWLVAGAEAAIHQRSTPKAIGAGLASGVTTMAAHSGGPPLAMYLLPLGLSKDIYAGTTSLFFTVGNTIKAVPWLLLVRPTVGVWELMAICLFAIPGGVWLGWRLHGRLDQRQIFRICYVLLVVTALKLLWDGVSGYLA